MNQLAVDCDWAQQVDPRFPHFRGGSGSDVEVKVLKIPRFWRVGMRALQVDRQTGHNAIDPLSAGRSDFHRLRRIEFIENRGQAELREALNAQVAIRGDLADHEARLVNRRNNQPMRGAAAHGNDHVPHVVSDRMEGGEALAYHFANFTLISGDSRRINESRQFVGNDASDRDLRFWSFLSAKAGGKEQDRKKRRYKICGSEQADSHFKSSDKFQVSNLNPRPARARRSWLPGDSAPPCRRAAIPAHSRPRKRRSRKEKSGWQSRPFHWRDQPKLPTRTER